MQEHMWTHIAFHLSFICHNIVFMVWSLSSVMNAKSTCWADESATTNTCSSSVYQREQPHFKAAQSAIPSRQHCNLQADTNHTLTSTQLLCPTFMHVHSYIYTNTYHMCVHNKHTNKEWTSSWPSLPQALLKNIQCYSALYRSGVVCTTAYNRAT